MKQTLSILLLLVVALSCTQEEFMPPPYGEKVPYEEVPKERLDAVLAASKSSLFQLALDGSTIPALLDDEWENAPLTFLVPSDAAFEEAGFTEEKLKNMDAAELDTIIRYHMLSDQIDSSNVRSTYGNIRIKSKLENKSLKMGSYSADFYVYPHYLAITDGKVLINGKVMGDYKISDAKEGNVIYIDGFLQKPKKTLWQTMKEDSRLSMFMEIVEANDASYATSSWDPIYISQMEDAVMKTQLDIDTNQWDPSNIYIGGLTSVFAPTNEAFLSAGYNSAEDFLQLNEPYWVYRGQFLTFAGGAPYNYRTFHKTDSVLTYHHGWAQRYYPTDGGNVNPTVFFSNDLSDGFLGNYDMKMEGYSPDSHPAISCPYTFSRENGVIKMRLKNAKEGTEAATVIEQDIMTLNGPLYIVDRLFIPNHF